jgi:hypothetical protein
MGIVPISNVRGLAVIRASAAPCTCRTVSPGTPQKYRCLDRTCPRHDDAAESARRSRIAGSAAAV